MILVTVGTQLPFPRLIHALDALAPSLDEKVIAQTGQIDGQLKNIEHHVSIAPQAFDVLFKEARVVVAHAGMGTVLAAKKYSKPLIIFPRRAALNEHRNDHQIDSAEQLGTHPGIHIAWDETELEQLLRRPALEAPASDLSAGLIQLREELRRFIVA